jgi:hypothetical protein
MIIKGQIFCNIYLVPVFFFDDYYERLDKTIQHFKAIKV